jgi:hypothetical protein
VAFRPTITRGLALSAMLILIFSNILAAISMPKGVELIKPPDLKGFLSNAGFFRKEKVTFFVSVSKHLAAPCKVMESLCNLQLLNNQITQNRVLYLAQAVCAVLRSGFHIGMRGGLPV